MKRLLQLVLIFAALAWCVPAHAQTAPTIVSYTDVSWTTTGSPKSTASVSWNSGDILVVLSGSESAGNNLGLPTATGLTFSNVVHNIAASTAETRIDTATAASTSSSAVSETNAAGLAFGLAVWVMRSSGGLGNHAEQHTTTKTVALTPVQANSSILWASFDFSAGALGSATPTPTHARQGAVDATHYTFYVDDLASQASTGATSYGVTGTASTGVFSIVVQEVEGTGGGGGAAAGFDKRRRYEQVDE